jgi:hypothetical protein
MKISKVFFLVLALLSACSSFDSTVVATNTPEDSLRKFPQITDISRYSEVSDSFENSPLVEHFPKTIPSEAKNIRFAYQPRIMQGAMFFELLMTLPKSQIDDLWIRYGNLEKYQFTEDKTINDIPEPMLYLIIDKNNEVDQNFSIFLISAESAGQEDFIWNHGTMYGVGINKITFEVIYWLEYW